MCSYVHGVWGDKDLGVFSLYILNTLCLGFVLNLVISRTSSLPSATHTLAHSRTHTHTRAHSLWIDFSDLHSKFCVLQPPVEGVRQQLACTVHRAPCTVHPHKPSLPVAPSLTHTHTYTHTPARTLLLCIFSSLCCIRNQNVFKNSRTSAASFASSALLVFSFTRHNFFHYLPCFFRSCCFNFQKYLLKTLCFNSQFLLLLF